MSKNILLLRDFDQEAQVLADQEQAVRDSLTREEFDAELESRLEVARKAAYDEGFEAGKASALESLQARQTSVLETLAPEIAGLTADHQQYCDNLEVEMTNFMRDLCEKLFPDLGDLFLEDRIRNEIRGIARRANGSPWREIRIPGGLSAACDALELPDASCVEVKIIEDAELTGASVKARWRNGRSEYDFDSICKKITSLLGGADNQHEKEEA
jgi:hypothetical protein